MKSCVGLGCVLIGEVAFYYISLSYFVLCFFRLDVLGFVYVKTIVM